MIDTQEEELINDLVEKFKNSEVLHMKLPGGSQLHIDRPLPFICLYRYPEGIEKSAHSRLVDTQPSFIKVNPADLALVRELLEEFTEILRRRFGAVMLLDIWAASEIRTSRPEKAENIFHLFCTHHECSVTLSTLQRELCEMPVAQRLLNNKVGVSDVHFPKEREMLIGEEIADKAGVQYVGLEVEPFYYDQKQNSLYPMLFRSFRNQLATALQVSFFSFVRLQTRHDVPHYHGLGRQKESDLVWKIDQDLVDINNSFDFLLLVTVTNHEEEWEKFKNGHFNQAPTFQYRLINVDPELLKRKLFNIPIEEVDDPTLALLFRDKRDELDRMLNMLMERQSKHFMYSSIQVFGNVEEDLNNIACELLEKYPPGGGNISGSKSDVMTAEEFAELARQEINYLKGQYPELDAGVQIRKDIEGLMVSKGQLLIDHHLKTPRSRAEALIQHEVGTHVLTYYNGKAQPLKQLYLGSPGYEDLQEGLAVLAEYLVGGLSTARLRTLAARVVAIHSMLGGADFLEVFRLLHKEYGFTDAAAFSLATRVFRGGGFTKDAVYLKGLVELLKYLSEDNPLEPLLIGKIRQDYIPFMDELINRKILSPAPLRPRYFSNLESQEKLKRLRKGANIFDLIES